ncbi:hypothetical protein [Aristaeella hokkaidonensis]|uniref:Uncharacterized protein n=1 Tax=Aristaeella hokkaidonensis TaxID=3046382 RepID=A0AC61N5U2_9FIRM|nr:hypothetical protein [Aristaeella hokkaidonensis]QUC66363.1 hypothetical protein JYE49_10900 [Aristaeella hokkaidonensis]
MKKTLALILTLALVLSLCISAYAACSIHGNKYKESAGSDDVEIINDNNYKGHIKRTTKYWHCYYCAAAVGGGLGPQNWTTTSDDRVSHYYSKQTVETKNGIPWRLKMTCNCGWTAYSYFR